MKYSSIFIILGNLFGVSLGVFIGVSNKKSGNVKTLISIALTLFLSFLSGMMGPDIKVIIDMKFPILGKINPISIITDNLYRVNLLDSTKSVGEGIFLLSVYSIVLISISYVFLRRRNYDSI
jgi:ABC-2 type transport system permease protein